jgi:DNA-directed RNA polymerase specialized sigma24 family protein
LETGCAEAAWTLSFRAATSVIDQVATSARVPIDDRDDLVAEAVLRSMQRPDDPAWLDDGSLVGWMSESLRRTAARLRRQRRRALGRRATRFDLSDLAFRRGDASARAETDVEELRAGATPKQKAAMHAFLASRSYGESAATLGLSIEGLRDRLRRIALHDPATPPPRKPQTALGHSRSQVQPTWRATFATRRCSAPMPLTAPSRTSPLRSAARPTR